MALGSAGIRPGDLVRSCSFVMTTTEWKVSSVRKLRRYCAVVCPIGSWQHGSRTDRDAYAPDNTAISVGDRADAAMTGSGIEH